MKSPGTSMKIHIAIVPSKSRNLSFWDRKTEILFSYFLFLCSRSKLRAGYIRLEPNFEESSEFRNEISCIYKYFVMTFLAVQFITTNLIFSKLLICKFIFKIFKRYTLPLTIINFKILILFRFWLFFSALKHTFSHIFFKFIQKFS